MHVMLDLETWGTRPGSALRSIGAVAFTPEGAFASEFYRNVDKQSCLDVGLTLDPATVDWWSQQSLEANAALLKDPKPLATVVGEFHKFFQDQCGIYVWSHGANFDEPLWSAAARAAGLSIPWKYWNARCTRTLYHATGFDPRSLPREGTHHNALDDAKYQARCVQAAFAKTRRDTAMIAPKPEQSQVHA